MWWHKKGHIVLSFAKPPRRAPVKPNIWRLPLRRSLKCHSILINHNPSERGALVWGGSFAEGGRDAKRFAGNFLVRIKIFRSVQDGLREVPLLAIDIIMMNRHSRCFSVCMPGGKFRRNVYALLQMTKSIFNTLRSACVAHFFDVVPLLTSSMWRRHNSLVDSVHVPPLSVTGRDKISSNCLLFWFHLLLLSLKLISDSGHQRRPGIEIYACFVGLGFDFWRLGKVQQSSTVTHHTTYFA